MQTGRGKQEISRRCTIGERFGQRNVCNFGKGVAKVFGGRKRGRKALRESRRAILVPGAEWSSQGERRKRGGHTGGKPASKKYHNYKKKKTLEVRIHLLTNQK